MVAFVPFRTHATHRGASAPCRGRCSKPPRDPSCPRPARRLCTASGSARPDQPSPAENWPPTRRDERLNLAILGRQVENCGGFIGFGAQAAACADSAFARPPPRPAPGAPRPRPAVSGAAPVLPRDGASPRAAPAPRPPCRAGSFIRQHELIAYRAPNTSGRFMPIRMVP